MSWPVLSGTARVRVCVCARAGACVRAAQRSQQEQGRAGAGNEKGSGHIPETGDTQSPHVGGPLKSRWGRAGDRGAGVQALVPASHAPRSPSLIALIIWNGAKHDGNGDLHASPGNGVCLCLCAHHRLRIPQALAARLHQAQPAGRPARLPAWVHVNAGNPHKLCSLSLLPSGPWRRVSVSSMHAGFKSSVCAHQGIPSCCTGSCKHSGAGSDSQFHRLAAYRSAPRMGNPSCVESAHQKRLRSRKGLNSASTSHLTEATVVLARQILSRHDGLAD